MDRVDDGTGGGGQADREGHGGGAEEHGGQHRGRTHRTGEGTCQAQRHRARQRQPPGEPVRPLPAAGPWRAADRDRLDRPHPPGPQRRQQGGQGDHRQRAGRDGQVDPPGDRQRGGAVSLLGVAEEWDGQQVAEQQAQRGADTGRDEGLRHIGAHHLARGEADRLEDADPADVPPHRTADHAGDDDHGHQQAEHPEGRHDRHDQLGVLGGGEPGVQVGDRADHRARCQRRAQPGPVGGDLGGAGGRGEAVEHLAGRGGSDRPQCADLGGDHPAVGGDADRPGDADHGQRGAVRHAGDPQHGPERVVHAEVAGEHDLARPGHPAAGLQGHVVDRAAGGGPAGHGGRRHRRPAVGSLRTEHRLLVGPRARGDPGQLGGGAEFGRTRPRVVGLHHQVRAALRGEGVVERRRGGHHQRPRDDGRGHGHQHGQRHHHGLHPPAAHPGADHPAHRALAQPPHRRTPVRSLLS